MKYVRCMTFTLGYRMYSNIQLQILVHLKYPLFRRGVEVILQIPKYCNDKLYRFLKRNSTNIFDTLDSNYRQTFSEIDFGDRVFNSIKRVFCILRMDKPDVKWLFILCSYSNVSWVSFRIWGASEQGFIQIFVENNQICCTLYKYLYTNATLIYWAHFLFCFVKCLTSISARCILNALSRRKHFRFDNQNE